MATMWEMSQLGLARAYVVQGDTTKATTAYQDFLTLWKTPTFPSSSLPNPSTPSCSNRAPKKRSLIDRDCSDYPGRLQRSGLDTQYRMQ